MKFNPITIILIIALIFPIVRGFVKRFSSKDLKSELNEVESDLSFITSLILGLYLLRRIFILHEEGIYKLLYGKIPESLIRIIDNKPMLIYLVILPSLVALVYGLCRSLYSLVNYFIFYPLLDHIEDSLKQKSILNRSLTGAFFQVPRSFCYVLFLTFLLNIISMLNINKGINSYLSESEIYNLLCREIVVPVSNSKIARQLPNIINNSFKVEIRQSASEAVDNKSVKGRTIVYYNGVTLEEGIKSNEAIDKLAQELVKREAPDREKARRLYNWIGSNVAYDYEKANRVLNNDFNISSGAISAFETKSGICFDYSCLYVAMSRAQGLKIRLITGEGFNGATWISHAWNQVYIKEEDKWINVDTTFYNGGNYFGTKRFDVDHRNGKVVGEW
jgi:hypothetical protein